MSAQVEYRQGDLFQLVKADTEHKYIYIAHVVNGLGKWGKGFVVPLAKYYPTAKSDYLAWHQIKIWHDGNEVVPFQLGRTQFSLVDKIANEDRWIVVCNMLAQWEIGTEKRQLRYNALACCMDAIADGLAESIGNELIENKSEAVIYAPLFGCGLSGGDFKIIQELIHDCWSLCGIPVVICYMEDKLPAGVTLDMLR